MKIIVLNGSPKDLFLIVCYANTLLAALATETEKIKLGHIVLCNSFRNPAYLAKVILSLLFDGAHQC